VAIVGGLASLTVFLAHGATFLALKTAGPLAVRARRAGLAFGLTALGIVALTAAVFTALFPRVMVSSGPGPALTIWSAASAHLTLLVMTVVAAIFVPLVLAYQGWSYWVFRQRLTRPAETPAAPAPVPHQ
jgi:cytochrome d ubiquinol oxidase subunit II